MSKCGVKGLRSYAFVCFISHRPSLQMTQVLSQVEISRQSWYTRRPKSLPSELSRGFQKNPCQCPSIPSRRRTPRSVPNPLWHWLAVPSPLWHWTLSARPQKPTMASACSVAPVPKVLLHLILSTAHRSSRYSSPHLAGKETQTYGFMSQLWTQTACFLSKSRLLARKP